MNQSWWMVVLALMAGCSPKPIPMMEEDAGVEPYDGPASNGVIPVFDPDALDGSVPLIDAGVVTVETRCCNTRFAISAVEPAHAVGVLEGSVGALVAGVPLSRADGGWGASACFPVNASSTYWYTFTWDGGLVDAGVVPLEDGGEALVVYPQIITRSRASDDEPYVEDATGARRNFYREVSSCDGLDGSVPR